MHTLSGFFQEHRVAGSAGCYAHADTQDRHCTALTSLCKASETFRESRQDSSQQTLLSLPMLAQPLLSNALANSAVLQSGLQ